MLSVTLKGDIPPGTKALTNAPARGSVLFFRVTFPETLKQRRIVALGLGEGVAVVEGVGVAVGVVAGVAGGVCVGGGGDRLGVADGVTVGVGGGVRGGVTKGGGDLEGVGVADGAGVEVGVGTPLTSSQSQRSL